MVDKLTSSVKPLTVVSTINDIIDNLGGSYSATNPTLTPVNGICTWVVTHNLGTKNVICTLYSGNLEISKSVNLDSNNALTITFNALDIVAAGTCTVVVVAQGGTASGGGGSEYSLPTASTTTLGGVKIDGTSITIDANGVISGSSSYTLPTASTVTLGGVKIDGTSITIDDGVISSTVDSTLSSTSTNPVQNKIIYPSLSNFIPAGTTITVKTDGTGDFTTIHDAITYLEGKWSNGVVTIQLGSGTFTLNSEVIIPTESLNMVLAIRGNGISNTVISTTVEDEWVFIATGIPLCGGIIFSNFTLIGQGSHSYGIHIFSGNHARIESCHFENCAMAIHSQRLSRVDINNCSFKSISSQAIRCADADIVVRGSLSFDTVGTCFLVTRGGVIKGRSFTSSYTNITTKTSQTVGTATASGWITGDGY